MHLRNAAKGTNTQRDSTMRMLEVGTAEYARYGFEVNEAFPGMMLDFSCSGRGSRNFHEYYTNYFDCCL